jgi:pyridoxine 4-dehydrogenase
MQHSLTFSALCEMQSAIIKWMIVISIFTFVESAQNNIAKSYLTQVGKLQMQPIGFGSWAWGNKFLWGYNQANDFELKSTYDYLVEKKVEGLWIDTAEVYGADHRSEKLLGNNFRAKYND